MHAPKRINFYAEIPVKRSVPRKEDLHPILEVETQFAGKLLCHHHIRVLNVERKPKTLAVNKSPELSRRRSPL